MATKKRSHGGSKRTPRVLRLLRAAMSTPADRGQDVGAYVLPPNTPMAAAMAERGENVTHMADNFVARTKVVFSGQTRYYYAASCDCGWAHDKFRVTRERAREDFDLLHSEGGSDG